MWIRFLDHHLIVSLLTSSSLSIHFSKQREKGGFFSRSPHTHSRGARAISSHINETLHTVVLLAAPTWLGLSAPATSNLREQQMWRREKGAKDGKFCREWETFAVSRSCSGVMLMKKLSFAIKKSWSALGNKRVAAFTPDSSRRQQQNSH